MAVNVKQLWEQVPDAKMTLVAGEDGLSRTVRWVHMVESAQISSFLEGEEIVFTTGVGLRAASDLTVLVRNVVMRGVSAIVLNLGPYIQTIEDEIVQICNERQVPLFSVPWEIHMAEIIRQFCLQITLDDKRRLELSSAMQNAILFPAQKELYVPHLENYGLHVGVPYTVVLFGEKQPCGEVERRVLLHQMESVVAQKGWSCLLTCIETYILLLFEGKDYTPTVLRGCCDYLQQTCTQLQKGAYCIGIGEPSHNIYCIAKSFQQAKCVLDLGQTDKLFYSELGLYRLLACIEDRETVRGYVNDQLGPLLQYDQMHAGNLLEVLCVYLRHNGSVKETAEELYVHRNTINYKIRRIAELLGRSLTDYETCSELLAALKLHRLLELDVGHLR